MNIPIRIIANISDIRQLSIRDGLILILTCLPHQIREPVGMIIQRELEHLVKTKAYWIEREKQKQVVEL